MKIRIKSSDSFEQNYEKSFELEKMINLEEKKNIITKMNMENVRLLIKLIPLKFTDMVKSISSRYSKKIKILRLLSLQQNFVGNMKFLQKNLKKKMEK